MARPETKRTVAVIRAWGAVNGRTKIVLGHELEELSELPAPSLRAELNAEFGIGLISPEDWNVADPRTVRDVRDLVSKMLKRQARRIGTPAVGRPTL